MLCSALILFSSGLFVIPKCFDAKATTPSTQENQKTSESTTKEQVSTRISQKDTTLSSVQSSSSSLTTEQKSFAHQAAVQGFYFAVNQGNGVISYEKASESQIQTLEKQDPNSKLAVHQVKVNGKTISVLSAIQN